VKKQDPALLRKADLPSLTRAVSSPANRSDETDRRVWIAGVRLGSAC